MSRRARSRNRETARKSAAPRASARRRTGFWQAGNSAVSRAFGEMQSAFGEDFSGVKVDSSPEAREAARTLGAAAVTQGETILLGPDAPPLGSGSGRRLLAHELAHVVQQRHAASVDADAVGAAGGSFESAANVAAGQAARGQAANVSAGGSAPGVQRQPAQSKEPFDVKEMMKGVQQKLYGPSPTDVTPEADKKAPKVDPDASLPWFIRKLKKLFAGSKEDKGPKMGPVDAPKPAGQIDVGKEADREIHTFIVQSPKVSFPMPGDKPKTKSKPKPRESEQGAEAPTGQPAGAAGQQPAGAAAQASMVDLQGAVASAMSAAQYQGSSTADLRLDAGLKNQSDIVLAQVESIAASIGERSPKVTTINVCFGSELAKSFSVGSKK